jgi:RES domain-containing protein
MYDQNLYEYDSTRVSYVANLRKGACLYRVTSLSHNSVGDVLAGRGPTMSRYPGRFHRIRQATTYCANNILVCISEVLFHMYRDALDCIQARKPRPEIRSKFLQKKCLIVTKLNTDLRELVYVDSKDIVEFDHRICGTTCVFPDASYQMFHDLSDRLRTVSKKGIIYPSARHSKDVCIALFDDETDAVDTACFEKLYLDLSLLSEEQEPGEELRRIDPFEDKLHPTMGYYKFLDSGQLQKIIDAGLCNPAPLMDKGIVDFVRRRYKQYPNEAVKW